jgi:hypothetical protein
MTEKNIVGFAQIKTKNLQMKNIKLKYFFETN